MFSPLTDRFVALGVASAVVATLLGAAASPDQPLSIISVFARAAAYILVVFVTAAATTYLSLLLSGEGQTILAREVAIRTAATVVWLPPLLMFSMQGSWFVLFIWAVLVIEVSWLVAFVRRKVQHNDAAVAPQTLQCGCTFSVLKQDFPSGISILGALIIQGSIFGAVDGHPVVASLLYLLGTTAFAYRALRMFQDLPELKNSALSQPIPAVLMTATFLVVFAWLPHMLRGGSGIGGNFEGTAANGHRSTEAAQANESDARKKKHAAQGTETAMARLRSLFHSGDSESRGSSFAIAKHILDSTFAEPADGTKAHVKTLQKTRIASAVDVVGPVFPGVELYPEVEPLTRLVAPPLPGSRSFGAASSDPLSIPFDGVYWFWRGPSDRPPSNSIVMHGSPSARFFRSTDGGMSMEARQNLGFMVDPKRYGAIEILFENADPFPNTVSILLKIRNTSVPGKPILSLGIEGLSAPPASSLASGTAATQRLRFPIPRAISIGTFDELTVSYYLKGARSDRSARIAIDRFQLVPRGG